MSHFHRRPLPDYSTQLAGRVPADEFGFASERLQIWYNNTSVHWTDERRHAHRESDECFIVLHGRIVVEVEGEQHSIGPREFCCFPRGQVHRVVDVFPPVESLMIRAPSVADKYYPEEE